MPDALVGANIGGFVVEEELGRGGMGVVYRARDVALRREVALKVLAPHLLENAEARTRFQREIESAVAIEHPNVVPVYAAGYESGYFFLAMRYVRGPDLWRILQRDGPFPEPRAMRLVGQIASALHMVHVQGFVHRDVKPQNVLLWGAGGVDEHAFLTDFGLAKALHESRRLTRMGALGTRGYMAPELLDGAEPTPSCDQFSLACLAFELLTGRLPFPEDIPEDEPSDFPVPLAFYAPGVSKRVRDSIERALSSDPHARFLDVRAFVGRDDVAQQAFERAQSISEIVASAESESQLVLALQTAHGLTDAEIAEIADLDKSRVLRLRRKAARRSLIGE